MTDTQQLMITDEQRQLLTKMTGTEKAALLMLSLREEDAAQIFRHFAEHCAMTA